VSYFSWDFNANCAHVYGNENSGDFNWAEAIVCNNKMSYGDSEGVCADNVTYELNVRQTLTQLWGNFTQDLGSGFENPSRGGGDFQVLKH